MVLNGWLGWPDRYIAAFGHPGLRARYLPFLIGKVERDQWLMCIRNWKPTLNRFYHSVRRPTDGLYLNLAVTQK